MQNYLEVAEINTLNLLIIFNVHTPICKGKDFHRTATVGPAIYIVQSLVMYKFTRTHTHIYIFIYVYITNM
jgi:hypothetical protein